MSPSEADRLFANAQTLFEQADAMPKEGKTSKTEAFRRVALMYQKIVDDGVRSGAVYYNQGNAWVRADEPGRAIAAYRSAQRYLPLDPYVAANLRSVLGSIPEQPKPLLEYVFFWQDWIGYPQKFRGALLLGLLTALCATVFLFYPRRWLRRVAFVGLSLTFLMSASAVYDWYRFDYLRHAVVAVPQAVPRKGNSLQYEPAFKTPLTLGSSGIVIDRRGDWVHLRFEGDQDGWLTQEQIVVY